MYAIHHIHASDECDFLLNLLKTKIMSCWTKPELENMLEDVVNELDLSEIMIEKHGQLGTAPAELVRLVLEQKDKEILMLKAGMLKIERT